VKTYTVHLHSPLCFRKNETLASLFDCTPTEVRVKAPTAEYAVVKALAMVPWELCATFSATEIQ
jgi:hypothetical protein